MPRVAVGSYHDLKPVSPKFLGKCYANIVCGSGVNLISLKRLVSMIANPAAFFSVKLFGLHELFRGSLLALKIDARNIGTGLRFDIVGSVFNNTFYFMQLR